MPQEATIASAHVLLYSHQRQRPGAGRGSNSRRRARVAIVTRSCSNAARSPAVRVVETSRPVREVEAEPRGRRHGIPGGRVAERTAVGGVGIGGQLPVGVDLRLGSGPPGLVVGDHGRAVRGAVDPVHVADEPDRAGVGGERDVEAEPELRRDRDRGARLLAPEEALEDGSRGSAHPGQLVGLQAGTGEDLVAGPPEHVEHGLGRPVGAGSNRSRTKTSNALWMAEPKANWPGGNSPGSRST